MIELYIAGKRRRGRAIPALPNGPGLAVLQPAARDDDGFVQRPAAVGFQHRPRIVQIGEINLRLLTS